MTDLPPRTMVPARKKKLKPNLGSAEVLLRSTSRIGDLGLTEVALVPKRSEEKKSNVNRSVSVSDIGNYIDQSVSGLELVPTGSFGGETESAVSSGCSYGVDEFKLKPLVNSTVSKFNKRQKRTAPKPPIQRIDEKFVTSTPNKAISMVNLSNSPETTRVSSAIRSTASLKKRQAPVCPTQVKVEESLSVQAQLSSPLDAAGQTIINKQQHINKTELKTFQNDKNDKVPSLPKKCTDNKPASDILDVSSLKPTHSDETDKSKYSISSQFLEIEAGNELKIAANTPKKPPRSWKYLTSSSGKKVDIVSESNSNGDTLTTASLDGFIEVVLVEDQLSKVQMLSNQGVNLNVKGLESSENKVPTPEDVGLDTPEKCINMVDNGSLQNLSVDKLSSNQEHLNEVAVLEDFNSTLDQMQHRSLESKKRLNLFGEIVQFKQDQDSIESISQVLEHVSITDVSSSNHDNFVMKDHVCIVTPTLSDDDVFTKGAIEVEDNLKIYKQNRRPEEGSLMSDLQNITENQDLLKNHNELKASTSNLDISSFCGVIDFDAEDSDSNYSFLGTDEEASTVVTLQNVDRNHVLKHGQEETQMEDSFVADVPSQFRDSKEQVEPRVFPGLIKFSIGSYEKPDQFSELFSSSRPEDRVQRTESTRFTKKFENNMIKKSGSFSLQSILSNETDSAKPMSKAMQNCLVKVSDQVEQKVVDVDSQIISVKTGVHNVAVSSSVTTKLSDYVSALSHCDVDSSQAATIERHKKDEDLKDRSALKSVFEEPKNSSSIMTKNSFSSVTPPCIQMTTWEERVSAELHNKGESKMLPWEEIKSKNSLQKVNLSKPWSLTKGRVEPSQDVRKNIERKYSSASMNSRPKINETPTPLNEQGYLSGGFDSKPIVKPKSTKVIEKFKSFDSDKTKPMHFFFGCNNASTDAHENGEEENHFVSQSRPKQTAIDKVKRNESLSHPQCSIARRQTSTPETVNLSICSPSSLQHNYSSQGSKDFEMKRHQISMVLSEKEDFRVPRPKTGMRAELPVSSSNRLKSVNVISNSVSSDARSSSSSPSIASDDSSSSLSPTSSYLKPLKHFGLDRTFKKVIPDAPTLKPVSCKKNNLTKFPQQENHMSTVLSPHEQLMLAIRARAGQTSVITSSEKLV